MGGGLKIITETSSYKKDYLNVDCLFPTEVKKNSLGWERKGFVLLKAKHKA